MIGLLKRLGYAPRTCVWELTLACNMSCRHCGSRAGKARPDELTQPEALRLCQDLADLGVKRLTLGGGEPTLRQDWTMLAEALGARGVRVNMVTNGRGWGKQQAARAKSFRLESVAFSVDGCEVTHNYIRRVKGQWRELLDSIDLTVAAGVPVSVVTQINRRNLQELEELHALLAAHKVRSWQLQLGNPSGNMADHPDLVIGPADILDIVPRVAKLRKLPGRPHVYAGDNVGYYGDHEADIRDTGGLVPFWVGCQAGCQVIGIESNGNVKGCLSLPSAMNGESRFIEGNIRQRSLREIWESPEAFSYNRKFKVSQLKGFCRTCEYAEICRGGCSWTAFSHTGDRNDNPYCYYRQAVERGLIERGGGPSPRAQPRT
jgi:radical SAM protein with 4Fe4S-binding SPASM domain